MTDRDPKRDPQKGDKLKRGRVIRVVTERLPETVRYIYNDGDGYEDFCQIKTWLRWARDAEVIHRGQ